jgi:hypothetical protein
MFVQKCSASKVTSNLRDAMTFPKLPYYLAAETLRHCRREVEQ